MRIAKLVVLTAAVTLVAALAAGCGGGDDDTEPSADDRRDDQRRTARPARHRAGAGDLATSPSTPARRTRRRSGWSCRRSRRARSLTSTQFDLRDTAKNSTRLLRHGGGRTTSARRSSSGKLVTLFGKVCDSSVVPPVMFGSTFAVCNYGPLPKKFTKGEGAKGCMVMLAPKHGKISEVQWRPVDDAEPITWTVKK